MKSARKRIDAVLVEQGIAPSREKAQALILAGEVLVNDTPVDSCGTKIDATAEIRLRNAPSPYVGRGGHKIEYALDHFQLAMDGLVALDIGASTGGFTDCLLQRGATKVYAVDVGTNQLAYRLRVDSRVVVMEQTHVLELKPEQLQDSIHFCTADLSFIGLQKVLPHIFTLLTRPFQVLALVKPQFELEPEYVEKGGVVKDPAHHRLAIERVAAVAQAHGCTIRGHIASELKGAKKGNQEYFILLQSLA